MWKRLFGFTSLSGGDQGGPGRKLLLDSLRADLKTLQGALAPSERRKLDAYTAAMEEFDLRQSILARTQCAPQPAPVDPPGGAKPPIEDLLEQMNEMALLALTCGMTQVIAVSVGCGFGHYAPTFGRIHKGTPFESENQLDYHGHDDKYVPATQLMYTFHASLLARLAQGLSRVTDGDHTLWDDTVMVLTSDNGMHHHDGDKKRWPVVVVGNAGGALRADGRYIRYAPGTQALADLYCSISTAVGVPTNDFGKGGREPVKGPIPSLMS